MRGARARFATVLCAAGVATGCGSDSYGPCVCKITPHNLLVNISVENCPHIQRYSIEPASVDIDGSVALAAIAVQPFGGQPQYTWSATGGQIAEPHSAQTTFKCTIRGAYVVTVTASNDNCTDTASGTVVCTSVDGGTSDASPDSSGPAVSVDSAVSGSTDAATSEPRPDAMGSDAEASSGVDVDARPPDAVTEQ